MCEIPPNKAGTRLFSGNRLCRAIIDIYSCSTRRQIKHDIYDSSNLILSIQLEIALGFFSGSSTDLTALKLNIKLFKCKILFPTTQIHLQTTTVR
jgi:hypothetical protein